MTRFRQRKVATVGALASIMLASCTLLRDLDALTDGETADAGDDAPADGRSSSYEAGSDGEVAVIHDARAAGDGDATPSPSRFCERGLGASDSLIFCDDFDAPDRTHVEQGGWTSYGLLSVLGTLNESIFYSPPRSAQLTFDHADGGSGRAAMAIVAGFDSTQTSITIEARIKPEGTFHGDVFAVDDRAGCSIYYSAGGGVSGYCPGGVGFGTAGALLTDKWNFFRVTLRREPASHGHLTFQVGEGLGQVKTEVSLPALDGGTSGLRAVQFVFGEPRYDSNGRMEVDDVLVTTSSASNE